MSRRLLLIALAVAAFALAAARRARDDHARRGRGSSTSRTAGCSTRSRSRASSTPTPSAIATTWSGIPPAERGLDADEIWFGVWVRAFNRSESPRTNAEEFRIVDTRGQEFEPIELENVNVFAYRPALVDRRAAIPADRQRRLGDVEHRRAAALQAPGRRARASGRWSSSSAPAARAPISSTSERPLSACGSAPRPAARARPGAAVSPPAPDADEQHGDGDARRAVAPGGGIGDEPGVGLGRRRAASVISGHVLGAVGLLARAQLGGTGLAGDLARPSIAARAARAVAAPPPRIRRSSVRAVRALMRACPSRGDASRACSRSSVVRGRSPPRATVAAISAISSVVAWTSPWPIALEPTARSSPMLRRLGIVLSATTGNGPSCVEAEALGDVHERLAPSRAPSGANTELHDCANACSSVPPQVSS